MTISHIQITYSLMKKDQKTKSFTPSPQWKVLIIFALFFIAIYMLQRYSISTSVPVRHTIAYSQFLEQLDAGNISSVTIKKLHIAGQFYNEALIPLHKDQEPTSVKDFKTQLPTFQGEGLIEKLRSRRVEIRVESSEEGSFFWQFLIGILPWVIIIGVWMLVMRGARQVGGGAGGLFTFGQSKATLFDVKKPKVTYCEVAGMDNVKKELTEVIEFLKDPGKFEKIGAKVPKGVLLIGPPGTGKTLLARATAGEAGVPFYSISASEFIEMFVGVGAARVRDMFKKAKDAHPSIIFIDEIDAVGRTRGAGFGGGHDEREQTLNQLLSEMDGFDPHTEVIVMAATNRPDVLDPALLRPGRFDRQLVIDKPGWKERRKILEVHVRNKKLADKVDLEKIARGTPGMTGADLENLANEAALIAVRKKKKTINNEDFDDARDKILMGTVREEIINDLEKRITAYHEAGHTLVSIKLPGTDPIHKVSIVPRGLAMGVTQILPEEDRHYYPKQYLVNKLTVALAGRCAEKLIFNDVSTGAQNDLKEATALAEKMVAQWGMSDKIGPLSLGRGEDHPFLGRELAFQKRYSEDMAWLMDQEIQKIILEAEARASEILKNNQSSLEKLAEALIKEETLEKEDVEKILNNA
uniref:ATP-dependent zinc metalloprotease FtsH n=3 Tax=Kuenenia stuttgartiensis TaxID=174633 RepID=Q1Q1P0_KUEST|nr:strongly similar to cell division protein FtsH [Candidatus Kuenenia stuttgartiensis]